jgi:spermidine synthase
MKLLKKYIPHYVVFLTSMGVMIIELVASRLVSKYFGNNLYTWTSIIGIVLGGISLGNYAGGRLADRFQVKNIISPLLLVTSFLIFMILILDLLVYRIMAQGEASFMSRAMIFRSLFLMLILFFLPSTSLGTISPIMAKYALEQSSKVGHTVGSIYAVSAIGSIVGTFLSGFLLIPLLGIATIIFIVSGLVALLALLMGTYRLVGAGWIAVLILLFVLTSGKSFSQSIFPVYLENVHVLYETDTSYSHLEVRDTVDEGRRERSLVMDRLIHNRYDPDNPKDLLYEYEVVFASLTEHYVGIAAEENDLHTLTLGGGACLFPAYLEWKYDSSWNEVIEIDPEVVRIAREYFDILQSDRLRIITADARNYVHHALSRNRQYDVVYLDAFSSFSVPYHLTTLEFIEEIAGILKTDGMFVTNCVDIFSIGRFLNAYVQTVAAVFPHVTVYVHTGIDSSMRSTFVVVGSHHNLHPVVLRDARKRRVARRIPPYQMQELALRNGNLILTDNHAPVEKMIGPVFLAHIK